MYGVMRLLGFTCQYPALSNDFCLVLASEFFFVAPTVPFFCLDMLGLGWVGLGWVGYGSVTIVYPHPSQVVSLSR